MTPVSHPKRICILGSTGSIGRQALEVIAAHPERFRVVALAAGSNAPLLARQAREFEVEFAVIKSEAAGEELEDALAGTSTRAAVGDLALQEAAALPEVDIVLAAISGSGGLLATLTAARAGKVIALANKEVLVAAGEVLLAECARHGAALLPVDSEHSGVFQCLMGQPREAPARIILTASGGAFRDWAPEQLAAVTPEQALAHPTWRMGPKVTVDSATLMNKGLEVIEARWLFGLDVDHIDVVLHRESIVHALVEFADGSFLAQLGAPDMRTPIQFALSYPERLPATWSRLDLAVVQHLTFAPIGFDRYPCLRLAYEAARTGGTAPAALSAADEVAVEWFLAGKLDFPGIARVVEWSLDRHQAVRNPDIQGILETDREVRQELRAHSEDLQRADARTIVDKI